MLFSYRFSEIPDIIEHEDDFPASNLSCGPKRPADKVPARCHNRRDQQDPAFTLRRVLDPHDSHRHRLLRRMRGTREKDRPTSMDRTQHPPSLSMLRCDSCGDLGEAEEMSEMQGGCVL